MPTTERRRRRSRHGRRRRRRRRQGHPLLAGLLVVVGFLASGLAGALTYFLPALTTALSSTGQAAAIGSGVQAGSPHPEPATGDPFTVLLLGSDDDAKFVPGHLLTQSMILVRVVPSTGLVTMLSIPRDLYVPISSGGTAKIDTAFDNGGASTAVATVERDFHVRVDHYVWIGLRGLVNLIDRLGGVDEVSSLLPLAGGLSVGNVRRVLLLPPYTSSASVDGQDVLAPAWSRILPLVATSFPD
jgi:LCP family protein required for cell wall assembly